MFSFKSFAVALLAGLSSLPVIAVGSSGAAETIYMGGPVLTMNDAMPVAEAVAVSDGRILAVGDLADVRAHQGEATRVVDLDGRALLPGFVDSHGHVIMGGLQARSANLLAPPDGEVRDIDGLVSTLVDWKDKNSAVVEATRLIVGFGYDQAQMTELRPPDRDDLDRVSDEIAVVVIHQSGHFGVLNSKALEQVGITSQSENPPGGLIRRREDGEPDGLLEENAFFGALGKLIGALGPEAFEDFARAGAKLWTRFGYTTAEEGRATPDTVAIARKVAAEGGFDIDVVIYPDVLVNREFIAENVSAEYKNRMRVAGAKLTIDGSPQGFTALRDRPYYAPVGHYPPGYAGYAAATMEQVTDAVGWAFQNGIQVITHANGEGATDMLIAAVEAATREHGPGRRPVLIHGQLMREDQVDALKRLEIFPSLFPMHTFYWGDWHRDHTVGPINADNISPTGWVRTRGMMFGTHHDAPVAFPDSMRVLDATVTRRSRSGDILGPDQRVDVMTALKAMTIWPAWQHFEENHKGSIEPGKLADFVVLSNNPLSVDPEQLDTLRVLKTIKEDRVVFSADDG